MDTFIKAVCKDSGYSQIYTDLIPFAVMSVIDLERGIPICQTFSHTGLTYELVFIHLSQERSTHTYSAYQYYKVYDQFKVPVKYAVLQTLKS